MFNRVQSTRDEKARFIKVIELKLTQVELFSFLFLREYIGNFGIFFRLPYYSVLAHDCNVSTTSSLTLAYVELLSTNIFCDVFTVWLYFVVADSFQNEVSKLQHVTRSFMFK